LRRLGQRGDDEADDQQAVVDHAELLRVGQRRPFEAAEPGRGQPEAEQEAGVAAAIGDEGEQRIAGGHLPVPGIADEQEGRDAAHFPADEGEQAIAGQQHELDAGQEEGEADEEPVEAGLAVQVVSREADDQPADQRGQRAQRQRQPVEHERESTGPVARTKPVAEDAMPRGALGQRHAVDGEQQQQAAECGQRGEARRQRLGGIAAGPAEQHTAAVDDDGEQRQAGHQPDPVGQMDQQRHHRTPPRTMAGASASLSPANQSVERATCGSTAGPDHGNQPRRGQYSCNATVDGFFEAKTIHALPTSSCSAGWRSRMAASTSGVCSTIEQQAHRLVDLDHLPGQAGAQVAARAVHHAEEAGDGLWVSFVPQP
jgi:hypothetical protein